MRQAIAKSCDVYFYKVAQKMGIDRMHEFMSAFGYGDLTGIDIPGEKAGLYASPEWKRRVFKRKADQVWFPGETISMGIGQGPITVTPCSRRISPPRSPNRDESSRPRAWSRPSARRAPTRSRRAVRVFMKPIDIATPEQWQVVYDGMVGAVTYGTAHAAGLGSKYKWAGKTGTAQVFTIKQTESTKHRETDERKRDHAWFIAFAPADDPKIAISVLVENGGFGASAAAPIARKVLDAYLLGNEAPADPQKAIPPREATAGGPAT